MAASTTPLVQARGLPILGSLLEMRSDRVGFMINTPRRLGPLVRLKIGLLPWPVVMVTSPELAGEVLVEKADSFVKAAGLSIFGRPLLGDGLLTSEHDHHKRQRRMMAPLFVQKTIASWASVMVERGDKAQASLQDGSTIDFADATMRLTLEIVGKTLFDSEVSGEADEIGEALTECLEYIMGSVTSIVPIPPQIPTPASRRYKRAIARLDETIYRMIAERKASGVEKHDVLSMLLAARDEEDPSRHMPDKQVRDELMTIFLAGHETTANALAWTAYLLAQNPHVRIRLEKELDSVLAGRAPTITDLPKLPYAMQVFKEAMRLYPPADIVARRADRDVEIGGHRFDRGTVFMINVIGIHRAPWVFDEPDTFDPDRFAPEREKQLPKHAFLPFGAGPRICIGNHFALMEGHLMVATFFRALRLELPAGSRIQPEPLVTLRPRDLSGGGMKMRVRRRACAS
ncbi:MAG: cytochrome P450 [Polyangiales bacterium]